MTRLECHVATCANNSDQLCCRPDIHVSGPSACASEQTCCSSYVPKRGSATDAVGYQSPNESMPIGCDAKNCVHNARGVCAADSISMDGSDASTKRQTSCETFFSR